jgi:serine kinase of HPr protein (carbohydrate metabolism regulator)
VLGVARPALLLPVRPASSMATLVEVAARDSQLRRTGPSAAVRLDDRFRRLAKDPVAPGHPNAPQGAGRP